MSQSPLQLAQQQLFEPGGINESHLDKVFSHLQGADLADLYFQSTRYESWVLEEGIIKNGTYSIDQGVGVRMVVGEQTGFAYSDEISFDASDRQEKDIEITETFVDEKLGALVEDQDLSRFIL